MSPGSCNKREGFSSFIQRTQSFQTLGDSGGLVVGQELPPTQQTEDTFPSFLYRSVRSPKPLRWSSFLSYTGSHPGRESPYTCRVFSTGWETIYGSPPHLPVWGPVTSGRGAYCVPFLFPFLSVLHYDFEVGLFRISPRYVGSVEG